MWSWLSMVRVLKDIKQQVTLPALSLLWPFFIPGTCSVSWTHFVLFSFHLTSRKLRIFEYLNFCFENTSASRFYFKEMLHSFQMKFLKIGYTIGPQWGYNQLSPRRTPLGPALSVRLRDVSVMRESTVNPFISLLFVRFASCLKSKIFVMQPWLLSVAVVWSGSVRMFCQPRWFLTITCCEWRGCQSRSLKRKQEELKPEEKRRMLYPLQCRYENQSTLWRRNTNSFPIVEQPTKGTFCTKNTTVSWTKMPMKQQWGDVFFSPSPSFTPMLTSGIHISSLPNLP